MKKSIKDFQVEKLENRKEFIFYCLLHLICCTCGTNGDGGSTTPPTTPPGGNNN